MKAVIIKISAFALVCALLFIAFWGATRGHSVEVFFFGFSDADAILIRHEDYTVLIDAAEEEQAGELINQLNKLGVVKLDLLIFTHPDKDHVGGAAAIFENFETGDVYISPHQKGSVYKEQLQEPLKAAGKKGIAPKKPVHIEHGEITLDIYPPGKASSISENEASLIVVLQHKDVRILLPGDAEEERLAEMMKYPVVPCNLYKLSHHGRDNDMSEQIIEYLKPHYAVVTAESAGRLTRKALEAARTWVFYTSNGTVRVISNGRSVKVFQ